MRAEDHEAEQTVLGAIALARGTKDYVLSTLQPDDFDHPPHRDIFESMRSIVEAKQSVSIRAVKSKLRERGGKHIETMALVEAGAREPQAADHFADVVRERASRRRFLAVRGDIDKISQESLDSAEAIAALKTKLDEIQKRRGFSKSIGGLELAKMLHEDLEARSKSSGTVIGVPTGLADLDSAILGWQPTKHYVIAGRPSSGKTSLAIGSALYAALHEWKRVLVVSFEMGALELGRRALAYDARVNLRAIQTGRLSDEEWMRVTRTMGLLSESRLIIEDRGTMDIDDVVAMARVRHAEDPLGLIVVDYLQLVDSGSKRKNESREQEVTRVSRKLKLLAMDLKLPVITLSQLSREVEKRANKRPIMSDLRESGAIEQDADVILLLYREAAYSEKADPNLAEIIVAKQRDGGLGVVETRWSPEWTRFDNLENRR